MAALDDVIVEIPCSFKHCSFKNGSVTSDHNRVEVKTYMPVDPSGNANLQVNWSPTGDGVFHNECWNALFDSESGLSDLENDMVREASKTAEYHNSLSAVKNDAKRIVDMLQKSKFAIAFTGAGISTSAGIGDFRGKSGKWTEDDRSKSYGASAKADKKTHFCYEDLRPTYTHEALAKLVELGFIKHVISQNCDGLHSLSGIPMDQLWELHGNVFHERCDRCGTRREWPHCINAGMVGWALKKRCQSCRCYHYTGRKCPELNCNGDMMDTVINFGDRLEQHVLDGALKNAKKNDLVLCLGTTLMVTPANTLIEAGKRPIRLVICNRQPTPYDKLCQRRGSDGEQYGCRVFGDCDDLMHEIMLHLLGPASLKAWENGREERLAYYSTRREH